MARRSPAARRKIAELARAARRQGIQTHDAIKSAVREARRRGYRV